ncbi:hypothetical protein EJ08DRAFT_454840 [Tothia fuscella]|uniref:Uncharacterized protein n=1 Tax=Tothia fuscella TaxID=1048955 RepID=A0A9P4NJE9_9PEZI|nr:hypothetical protein EJ08DRAFT_454840 [Tothia fuscella]
MEASALIDHILKLQQYVLGLKSTTPSGMTKEKVDEKRRQVRNLMNKGIRAQFKWKPKVKNGTARWSYLAVIPDEAVFLTLLNLPSDWKKKTLKLEVEKFEDTVARDEISVDSRYVAMQITGKDVKVMWNPEDLTFKVNGTYGRR